MTTLAIGVNLPDTLGIGPAARHAEALGLESVWAADLIIGDGTPALDSTVALATAAAVTERLRVGFGVLILPIHPVTRVAAQIAALQQVSGNRVILGIGAGGFPGTPFWRAVGGPTRARGSRTDAALAALPHLIAGEPTRLALAPDQPVVTLAPPAPVPPILIGGNSDAAIRRAATYGDGWFPSLLTPDTLVVGAARLREHATERGRATPSITVGGHAMPGDTAAARTAREAFVRSLITRHGMTPDEAALIPIVGSPTDIAERFAAYAAVGVERLVLSLDGGEWPQQCALIAEAYALLG